MRFATAADLSQIEKWVERFLRAGGFPQRIEPRAKPANAEGEED